MGLSLTIYSLSWFFTLKNFSIASDVLPKTIKDSAKLDLVLKKSSSENKFKFYSSSSSRPVSYI